MFGVSHFVCILIMLCLIVLIFFFRERIRRYSKERYLRFLFGIILIIDLLAYNLYNYSVGIWSIQCDLPLYLCSICMFLSGVLFFTKSYSLFEVLYFWALCGTTQALITPSLVGFGFPHFRFFQYMIGHIGIIITIFYFIFVHGYRITFYSMKKSLLYLNLAGAIVLCINLIIGSNYMTLMGAADTPSVLDYFPEFPFNLIVLEAIAIIFFSIAYLPFRKKLQ